MNHPAMTPGAVAVITGAAAGIGLAAATKFSPHGPEGLHCRSCWKIASRQLQMCSRQRRHWAPRTF